MKNLILSCILFSIVSCEGQINKIYVIIKNKSNIPIDSIIFPHNNKLSLFTKTKPTKEIKFSIDVSNAKINHEGAF